MLWVASCCQGVEVSEDGLSASCSADDAWLGLRGRPGVLKGGLASSKTQEISLKGAPVSYERPSVGSL